MTEITQNISDMQKVEVSDEKLKENEVENVVEKEYKTEIVWSSLVINALLHLTAFYGLFLPKQWKTIAFGS